MHERPNTVPASGLCQIHSAVRHLHQLFLDLSVGGISCYAKACRDLSNSRHKNRRDRCADAFGNLKRALTAALRKDYAELLAAVTRAQIYFANNRPHRLCNVTKRGVASWVPIRIVDSL